MAEKAKPALHQECWQLMAVLHSAQTGGGVPGSYWEEIGGMGGETGSILCPHPAVQSAQLEKEEQTEATQLDGLITEPEHLP